MTSENRRRWPIMAAVAVLAAGLAAFATSADAGTQQPTDTATKIVGAAPPLPAVRTSVEPGRVNVEKLNARVKDDAKRKQFARKDRQKYGLASKDERGPVRRFSQR